MKLLAIDTSTKATVLGLQLGEDIIDRTTPSVKTHSRDILPSVSALLDDAGITLGDLDAIVFGQGPGSFTGLRIAVGVVQGLAYGIDKPVVPVSTLAVLSQAHARRHGECHIIAALHARAEEIYYGVYRYEEGLAIPDRAEAVAHVDELPPLESGRCVGVGDAWHLQESIEASLGIKLEATYDNAIPATSDLLTLGSDAFLRGRVVSPLEATPVYLREQVTST